MPANPPVDFEERAKRGKGSTSSDYPYAIKSTDLMRNFVYATVDIADGLFEEVTGIGGHTQRRLKIPSPPVANAALVVQENRPVWLAAPANGTFVLGCEDGIVKWIGTEDCGE